ncbi:hypothetical protein [Paraburkholderia domus]|uniref:Uncharacterized protein n=1 Tax=Paraburkholderia domus TaxID=2793075 RepID=A0A9N8NDD1_9BURK|nr:hypothetical protein [Paraburkholderia domus]MBK5162762.1 hypothetical protein [Burkholderia sp. R-70211]CAE6958668.1 hypothetical protein R70211_06773 [Paraburkholderia domus]
MQSLVERLPLDVFMPYVIAGAALCPESMALAYVRDACIDFATRSNTLRRRTFIHQQCGVRDYPVWPDCCEQIVRINEAHVDGWCYRGARDTCCFDRSGALFTVSDGLLHISSEPSDDRPRSIELRFTVTPTRDACEVDATLFNDWQNAITDGALARLYMLPGYPFSAPQLGVVRERAYNGAVSRARIRSLKSDTGDVTMARGTPFV